MGSEPARRVPRQAGRGRRSAAGRASRAVWRRAASAIEVAVPAVRVEPPDLLGRQPAAVAGGGVALDVADRAHAGDDRRHLVVREHVAQRRLRDLLARDAEVVDDRLHALGDLALAVAVEVAGAEVALGELAVGTDRAG